MERNRAWKLAHTQALSPIKYQVNHHQEDKSSMPAARQGTAEGAWGTPAQKII